MSDEYTKTVVIRDRSQVRSAAFTTSGHTRRNEQPGPDASSSEQVGQDDYPDFEDTSWLT